MRHEPLLSAVIFLTAVVWLFSTLLSLYWGGPAKLSQLNWDENLAYLSKVIVAFALGIVLMLFYILLERSALRRKLAPQSGLTSRSTMGPMPSFWAIKPLPSEFAEVDPEQFPRLYMLVRQCIILENKRVALGQRKIPVPPFINVEELQKNPSRKGPPILQKFELPSDEILSAYSPAFIDALKIFGANLSVPASSKVGGHANVSLFEHCCRVAENSFNVFDAIDYEGVRPRSKTVTQLPPKIPAMSGKGIITGGHLKLPLLVFTCLVHDIGKIRTFQLGSSADGHVFVKKVVGDHGPVGAAWLAQIPGVIKSSYAEMLKVMVAISHYHTPSRLPQDLSQANGYSIKCDVTQCLMDALIDADIAACTQENHSSPEDYRDDAISFNPLGVRPLREALIASLIPSAAAQPYNYPTRPSYIGHVSSDRIYVDLTKLSVRVAKYLDIEDVNKPAENGLNPVERAIIDFLFFEKMLICDFANRFYAPQAAVFSAVAHPPAPMNKQQKSLIEARKKDLLAGKDVIPEADFNKMLEAEATTGPKSAAKTLPMKRVIMLSPLHQWFSSARLVTSKTVVNIAAPLFGEATVKNMTDEEFDAKRAEIKARRDAEILQDLEYRRSRVPVKSGDSDGLQVLSIFDVKKSPSEEADPAPASNESAGSDDSRPAGANNVVPIESHPKAKKNNTEKPKRGPGRPPSQPKQADDGPDQFVAPTSKKPSSQGASKVVPAPVVPDEPKQTSLPLAEPVQEEPSQPGVGVGAPPPVEYTGPEQAPEPVEDFVFVSDGPSYGEYDFPVGDQQIEDYYHNESSSHLEAEDASVDELHVTAPSGNDALDDHLGAESTSVLTEDSEQPSSLSSASDYPEDAAVVGDDVFDHQAPSADPVAPTHPEDVFTTAAASAPKSQHVTQVEAYIDQEQAELEEILRKAQDFQDKLGDELMDQDRLSFAEDPKKRGRGKKGKGGRSRGPSVDGFPLANAGPIDESQQSDVNLFNSTTPIPPQPQQPHQAREPKKQKPAHRPGADAFLDRSASKPQSQPKNLPKKQQDAFSAPASLISQPSHAQADKFESVGVQAQYRSPEPQAQELSHPPRYDALSANQSISEPEPVLPDMATLSSLSQADPVVAEDIVAPVAPTFPSLASTLTGEGESPEQMSPCIDIPPAPEIFDSGIESVSSPEAYISESFESDEPAAEYDVEIDDHEDADLEELTADDSDLSVSFDPAFGHGLAEQPIIEEIIESSRTDDLYLENLKAALENPLAYYATRRGRIALDMVNLRDEGIEVFEFLAGPGARTLYMSASLNNLKGLEWADVATNPHILRSISSNKEAITQPFVAYYENRVLHLAVKV